MDETCYHVAVFAWRADKPGLISACIKCSPGEDIAVGAEKFAHLYFPDADGWEHHAWHYGRIADDIIALEQVAAHAPSYTIERADIKSTVLTHDD